MFVRVVAGRSSRTPRRRLARALHVVAPVRAAERRLPLVIRPRARARRGGGARSATSSEIPRAIRTSISPWNQGPRRASGRRIFFRGPMCTAPATCSFLLRSSPFRRAAMIAEPARGPGSSLRRVVFRGQGLLDGVQPASDPFRPWTKEPADEISGSGVIIEGKRIRDERARRPCTRARSRCRPDQNGRQGLGVGRRDRARASISRCSSSTTRRSSTRTVRLRKRARSTLPDVNDAVHGRRLPRGRLRRTSRSRRASSRASSS